MNTHEQYTYENTAGEGQKVSHDQRTGIPGSIRPLALGFKCVNWYSAAVASVFAVMRYAPPKHPERRTAKPTYEFP